MARARSVAVTWGALEKSSLAHAGSIPGGEKYCLGHGNDSSSGAGDQQEDQAIQFGHLGFFSCMSHISYSILQICQG